MENFKQIAEDCLAGKLSGTFILHNGKEINSEGLIRSNSIHFPYTFFDKPFTYTNNGSIYKGFASPHECDIVNFVPDMKKEQIIIDIPEGMQAIQETVDGEIQIKFVKKELTYEDICNTLDPTLQIHNFSCPVTNNENFNFVKKVEVLRKLTNIRNYFGKPENDKGYGIFYHEYYKKYYVDIVHPFNSVHVRFSTKEHAEQAIKMLGDEVKYLFEPW